MARIRFPKSRLVRGLLVLALLLVANGIAVRLVSDPLMAVQLKAAELNGGGSPPPMLAGGYESTLFGVLAHGRFQLEEGEVLELRLARQVAFLPWRLTMISVEPAPR